MTSTTKSDRAARPARTQAVLTVRGREPIGTHTVRVVAGGPGFDAFRTNEFADKYVKIIFADPSLGLGPPYDLARLRDCLPPEHRPVTRTYTVRAVDEDRQQLAIDFVLHGERGVADRWAASAESGQSMAVIGAGGGYRPDPFVDWHLFVGDESALPAICSAWEALPRTARGIAYLETSDDAHYPDVEPPSGVELVWLQRDTPGTTPDILAGAIRNGAWLNGRVGVFAHGERESMKAVRTALKAHVGDRDQVSLSGYWAYGRTEDVFQAEKGQPIGQIGS